VTLPSTPSATPPGVPPDLDTILMSLAGLAVSIGVLVDSSIVTAENAMHRLKRRRGDAPVRGDTRGDVLAACRQVGRPVCFAVVVILLSFLPVFALGGLEGKMFHSRAHEVVRHARRRAAVGHTRPGPPHDLRPRPTALRGGGRTRPQTDRRLPPGPRPPARPAGGHRLVRRGIVRPRRGPAG
jgi:hypothetical protein